MYLGQLPSGNGLVAYVNSQLAALVFILTHAHLSHS